MSQSGLPYHIPALLEETISLLEINPEGTYVDATFGGGGHSRAILEKLGPKGRLFGFDRDTDALANAPADPRFTFVHSDFRFIQNWMEFYNIKKVDGILADLGVSFHHFDTPERGFSFRNDAPLDMRMNQDGELTAEQLVNTLSEADLTALLRQYTDLKNASAIARAICTRRRSTPIATTGALAAVVEPLLNKRNIKKELAQVFQAIRIATNDEFASLNALLESSLKLLKKGGRLAILTYHSGEDKIVKDFMKSGSLKPEDDNQALIFGARKSPLKLITTTPLVASPQEVEANPRARSAKLRVAAKA
ncbi:MAG: 16S rRNA (cytosine(1402)-N(4))-methyltransferase RsmH [Muribaculaceae bacterium]|nr:16S rRNA (cytosine(1402)-N(4))-methyltransferase RsmH [Muribaculaceae bacterium]